MKLRKIIYPAIAAIGIGGLGAYAYYKERLPHQPNPASATASVADGNAGKSRGGAAAPAAVEVVKVTSETLVEDINAIGTLQSNQSVVLKPEVSGRITQLNFRDGQPVRQGQVLVEFDASVNRAEVQQAKAELSIARANFARNAELAEQKFVSERARDESAANVQVLEAKLALAEAKLAKLQIRAPFSGVVGIRSVSIGDYVKDGADLVNLEDISSVKVDFRVPEKFMNRIKPGQQIEVEVDALPGKAFRARVDAINPLVDSTGRSALLRGRIANQAGQLKPGMYARVRLILDQRQNALVVPEEAIVPQGDKVVVWKVVDGKAIRSEVKTGMRRAAKVEILDGLQPGDLVVTAGQIRLSRDGTPVRLPQAEGQNGGAPKPGDGKADINPAAMPSKSPAAA